MAEVGLWLKQIASRLSRVSGKDNPALEARLLLAHVLGKAPSWVLAHVEHPLSAAQEAHLENLVARRLAGEPLPYILGHWEFYRLDFRLSPATLIPRPETELLVDVALDWLRAHPTQPWVADVGTGSGCVAVSLAVHIPELMVLASDVSFEALRVAQENARRHGVAGRLLWLQADVLSAIGGKSMLSRKVHTGLAKESATRGADAKFALICANLPYIPSRRLPHLEVAQHEPRLALDGGEQGLRLIRRLLEQAGKVLSSPGLLLMEVDRAHARQAARLAQAAFPQGRVELRRDLAGHERLLCVFLGNG